MVLHKHSTPDEMCDLWPWIGTVAAHWDWYRQLLHRRGFAALLQVDSVLASSCCRLCLLCW